MNPSAKAIIKAAEYLPAHEPPGEDHPYRLITGRTIYQFHTRTKTARVPQLQKAAPQVWVEISVGDAAAHGVEEGDLLEIYSSRGVVHARARITLIRDGVLFLPFHYGYWDTTAEFRPGDSPRAANELTITDWDPCSKQPIFKTSAAGVRVLERGNGVPSPAPTTTASAPVARVQTTVGGLAAETSETYERGRA